jgi:Na+/proline symporter
MICRRFGPVAKTLVVMLALITMCTTLLAEYTAIGAIFSEFVGSVSWGIIISVSIITLAYTAFGESATACLLLPQT